MRILTDITQLFIPPRCHVCGALLLEGERGFCSYCRLSAPLTGYEQSVDNPIYRAFWGIVPIERASALLYFRGGWREAIHSFKYSSAWRVALNCGEWIGKTLIDSGTMPAVDVVVPVPLHPLKRLRRGYNQSTYIAEGVARELGVELSVGNVVRIKHNASQTRTIKSQRWENVKDIFAVRHPESLAGKHILLVDDVFTTGATISSCALAIIHSCEGVRISIATLATAHSE